MIDISSYRPAAMTKTIEQLERNDMDITAVQKIRWTGTRNQKISKSVVFYNGNSNNQLEFRTGFVIQYSVLEFKPVNE